jgi:hypothetical protein
MRSIIAALVLVVAVAVSGCGSATQQSSTAPTSTAAASAATSATSIAVQFTAHVWADNWYSLYVNGQKVAEDSEPITQVRSFNADTVTFTATYPLTIAMITKDYTEGSSGLEYIGTPQQQMGDGGFIAQFTETATGKVIAVTNDRWQGLAIERAPLSSACVTSSDPNTTCTHENKTEPDGWTNVDFDASSWATAIVYTTAQVGPKGGYDTVTWDPTAKLIWTSDLFVDNTILWRYVALQPD